MLGSRYCNGIRVINWPLRRLMLSMGAGHYVRLITGMPFTDPTGGYKCFRRRALEACRLDEINSNGYSFQIEMTHKLWRQGLRVIEVPIVLVSPFRGYRALGADDASGGPFEGSLLLLEFLAHQLRAAKLLEQRGVRAQWELAGTGQEQARITELVERLDVFLRDDV